MAVRTTPTLASLEQTRARQQATLRILRPLAFGVVLLVGVAGSRTEPRPGLSGDRLGVLLGLLAFAVGVGGMMLSRGRSPTIQAPFFFLLVLGAAALVWVQPNGPGYVGVFIAVGAATMRSAGWLGPAVTALALGSLALAHALGAERSPTAILLSELGVLAFFVVALLSRRLRDGQEHAERLLLELEQSREAHEQALVLAERQRLAREIHDVLAHSLSGLVLQLEAARLLANHSPGVTGELANAVERAHHLAKAGLEEARHATAMLRDDDLPGPQRLPALAREFERDTGVPCDVEVTGAVPELDSQARLTVYRVAQEALTNVRKHAHPNRVELRLSYEPGGARLTVEDFASNGMKAVGTNGGYGLTGMRERAELLGATFTAAPTDSGFRVELWVPA